MNKSQLLNDSGSMLIEFVFILVAAVMPVLLAATSLAQVLEAQSRLELLTREASRSFALAATNQAGQAILAELQQQPILDTPVKLKLNCSANCIAGSSFQITGSFRYQVFAIPFLPGIELDLTTTVLAKLDKYLER